RERDRRAEDASAVSKSVRPDRKAGLKATFRSHWFFSRSPHFFMSAADDPFLLPTRASPPRDRPTRQLSPLFEVGNQRDRRTIRRGGSTCSFLSPITRLTQRGASCVAGPRRSPSSRKCSTC